MPAGPISRLDRASSFRVRLDGGALGSATELALLAGANIAAIENVDGEWEVLQFQSAVLTAPSTYQLSLLLRGQAGTEGAMRSPVAAGARFVLLDGALARVDMGPDEVGLAYTWRCGPANRNIGDASYLDTTHAFRGLGLRPLSPHHLGHDHHRHCRPSSPVLGPALGLNVAGELIRQLGDNVVLLAQAIGGVAGTAMAIWGRIRATQPIERRPFTISL